MTEIISLPDGKRAFLFTDHLDSKHLITTNDFGCVKDVLFEGKINGLNDALKEHFGKDDFFVISARHGDIIHFLDSETNSKIHPGDAIFYVHKKEKEHSGAIISLTTGDCPVFLLEVETKRYKLVGGVHSGWKGTRLNIAGKAIAEINKLMKDLKEYSFNLKSIKIALWTGICKRCYVVDHHVRNPLAHYQKYFEQISADQWKLDMTGVIKEQLVEAGIDEAKIKLSGICPHCHHEEYKEKLFYSNRRKELMRNALFIMAD